MKRLKKCTTVITLLFILVFAGCSLVHKHKYKHSGLKQKAGENGIGVWQQELVKCDCGKQITKPAIFHENLSLSSGTCEIITGK